MTAQEEFFARLEELHLDCVAISKVKNADYAHGDDPFQNFRVIERLTAGQISTESGILVRMSDKMQRISNLLQPGREAKVVDESILDTLSDLSNYALILRVYLENKNGKEG